MQTESFIPGKDASLEFSIATMQQKLAARGFFLEESSWLNPAENIWSVHMRDKDCPLLFTNGKGASELAARASALGEFFERLGCHYFWTHFYLGQTRRARICPLSARALVRPHRRRRMASRTAESRVACVL
jgi:ribosomal protein S12 methylthiotransferase accessory factor